MITCTEDSFMKFAQICEELKSTSSKNDKVNIVSQYISKLDDDSLKIACGLLSGEIFPPYENIEFMIGYSTIVNVILDLGNLESKSFDKIFIEFGDLGEAAERILTKKSVEPLFKVDYTLIELYKELRRLAGASGKGSYSEKKKMLEGLYLNLSPLETKYLTKILTGEMRIGFVAGLVVEAISEASKQKSEEVNEAYLLTNDLSETAVLSRYNNLSSARLEPLNQTNFMLADSMQTAEEIQKYFGKELICEYKLDGIRAQCHKKKDLIKIFTRRGNESSNSFPEIQASLREILGDYIIDGEIIAFKNGKPLPFSLLQHRLQRKEITERLIKEIPLTIFIYDILYLNGEPLYKKTLVERKAALLGLKPSKRVRLLDYRYITTQEEIEKMFDESISQGYEGLMLKDPMSIYTVGKRGKNWVKLKKEFDTLDTVIVASERGHGKRANIFSDYIFSIWDNDELKTIGKAYSGLTDKELSDMNTKLKDVTVKDEGWRIIVKPEIVIEVAFNGIQKSERHESGYALRFPRIKRIREDKSIEQADNIEKVKSIFERQYPKN